MASQVDNNLVRAGLEGFAMIEKYYGPPGKVSQVPQPKAITRKEAAQIYGGMKFPKTINSSEAAQIYGGMEFPKTINSSEAAQIYGGMEFPKTINSSEAAQIYGGKQFLDKRKPFGGA